MHLHAHLHLHTHLPSITEIIPTKLILKHLETSMRPVLTATLTIKYEADAKHLDLPAQAATAGIIG